MSVKIFVNNTFW